MVTKIRKFKEFERVAVTGQSVEGFVLADVTDGGGYRSVTVLADNYHTIIADAEAVRPIQRVGDVKEYAQKSPRPTVKMTEFEYNQFVWYRMALIHSFWDRQREAHPDRDPMLIRAYQDYWEFYKSGTKAELPVSEDIRVHSVPIKQGVLIQD